jgi:tetratricopeptide (TPR) repeat protein
LLHRIASHSSYSTARSIQATFAIEFAMSFLNFLPGGIAKAALASLHYQEYQKSEKLSDLDEAIAAIKDAINETPRSSDNRLPRYRMQHGTFMWCKYERVGNNLYYSEAMSLLQRSLDETEDCPNALRVRKPTLRLMVAMLTARWEQSKTVSTLVELSEKEFELARLFLQCGKKISSARALQAATSSCAVAWSRTKDPTHIDRAVQRLRSMLDDVTCPDRSRICGEDLSGTIRLYYLPMQIP